MAELLKYDGSAGKSAFGAAAARQGKAKIGLNRVGRVIKIMPIERQASLKPQRIPGTKANRPDFGLRAQQVGKGGRMLKTIGQGARLQMEKVFSGPVYLELFVKVVPGWRRSAARLAELGYRGE